MNVAQALLRALPRNARRGVHLLAILPIFIATVVAHGDDRRPRPVVALSFDAASESLLKAHAHALYRGRDNGGRWTRVSLPPEAKSGRVAAAATAKGKAVWYIVGPGLGVLRSANQGATWEARNDGLPGRDVVAVTTHADRPDTVYVYIAEKGIFRSEDAGQHWKLMDGGPREPLTQFVHSDMPGSMQSGWLFAATPTGVARSMDCFCGWYDAGSLNANVYTVAYDPKQPQRVYAATEKGLFLSANGGEEWTRAQSPGRVVTALVVSPGGALYAGSEGRLFHSTDGAKTWERVDA